MTAVVPRHAIDAKTFEGRADEYRGYLGDHIPRLPERPDNLFFVETLARALLGVLLIEDPTADSTATLEAAQLAEQAATGLFRVVDGFVTGERDSVDLGFGGEAYRVPTGPNQAADTGRWLTAFWWATVARDTEAGDMLARYPVERLRDTGDGGVADEFQYEWVDLLQTAWRDDLGSLADRAKSLDTTSKIGAQTVIDHLIKPTIDVFTAIAADDEKVFAKELAKALKRHRKYFDTAKRRGGPDGFVSVPLLALTCWAHDRGMRIDVESEYIPQGFIDHPDWMLTL
ncbi:immunity 49 family protein [Nocardia niigatensis]|uniref:immunity 49 family protein n=1 Tax=Nocardia niigatensis TaxID=209249 RepID=UPI00031B33B8|nr:immunity 49 family protein [Nocardia niigatensis]